MPWLSLLSVVGCGGSVPEPATPVAHQSKALETKEVRRFVPGRVIVKFIADANSGKRVSSVALSGFVAQSLRPLSTGAELWSLTSDGSLPQATSIAEEEARTLSAIESLRKRSDVEYAHEDLYLDYSSTPNDPLYPLQWSYPAIDLSQAWDYVTGNVTVALLDTGRLNHPDLVGRWTTGRDFGVTPADSDPTDDGTWHHGMHVAGIVGANTNNSVGGAGICQGCLLMPVKVSIDDHPVMSNVDEAIIWASQNGARVINMSFGTGTQNAPCSTYPDMQAAVNFALAHNTVLVAAAGNDNFDTSKVTPASCTGVIAVAASTRTNVRASWSNRGARVDLTAPGGGPGFYGNGINCLNDGTEYSGTDGVVSSWAIVKNGTTLLPGDYCYRYLSGTSMAAPHVAGVAALLLSQNPAWTPAQVTARLKATATPIPGCTTDCGTGLLNALRAVAPPLSIPSFACTSSQGTFSCSGSAAGGMGNYVYGFAGVANATVTAVSANSATGTCTPNTAATVRMTVTDRDGTMANRDASFTCGALVRDAQFGAMMTPVTVYAGRAFTASVTMRNTGTQTWTAADNFKLGAQSPQDNSTWVPSTRVLLAPSDAIATGQQKIFTINATAPMTPGTYAFQWRMVQEFVTWFGDYTPVRNITVIPDPCYCPPGGECPAVVCPEPM
ncbi:S8 family serine peptidase [Myxococcaceae bacterium JPH2]|nr:S8 family serine peptidase [Myxococcaceae bacterium JPH2]